MKEKEPEKNEKKFVVNIVISPEERKWTQSIENENIVVDKCLIPN